MGCTFWLARPATIIDYRVRKWMRISTLVIYLNPPSVGSSCFGVAVSCPLAMGRRCRWKFIVQTCIQVVPVWWPFVVDLGNSNVRVLLDRRSSLVLEWHCSPKSSEWAAKLSQAKLAQLLPTGKPRSVGHPSLRSKNQTSAINFRFLECSNHIR